jgi:hypothetical protein
MKQDHIQPVAMAHYTDERVTGKLIAFVFKSRTRPFISTGIRNTSSHFQYVVYLHMK